ncbi:MAG TPA: hypothetical protein VKY74_16565 [Chloroflexia bacterium]|nr:hypothetical protein [Chloroflexia bacterium]
MKQSPDEIRLRAALREQAVRVVPTAPDLWPAIATHVPARRRATRGLFWATGGAVLILLAATGLLGPRGSPLDGISGGATGPPNIGELAPPPPGMTAAPGEQWSAQNAAGLFQIVVVDVRAPQDILLFYAMRADRRGTPQVAVHLESSAPGPPAPPISLPPPIMHPLGQLAEFDVGFMQIQWPQSPGTYVLVVEGTSPAGGPRWRVTPVRNLRVVADARGYGMLVAAPPAIGRVAAAGPYGTAGFRLALLGRSPIAVPPIHVVLDGDGAVRLVDAATWSALWPTAPPFPGRPVPTEDLEHPVIAPTYPPTPTWDVTAPTFTPPLPPPPPTPAAPLTPTSTDSPPAVAAAASLPAASPPAPRGPA